RTISPSRTGPRVTASADPLEDELAHATGIRLAARRLHDRTDDRADRTEVAPANLLEDVGLRGERLVDRGEQRPVVGYDLEAARDEDLLRVALAGQDALEHLARELVVDAARVNESVGLGDLRGRDGQLLESDVVLLLTTRELAHPPLAGAGRARARGDGRLDEVDRPRVDDVAHLGVGVAPLALQAAPTRDRQLGQARTDLLDPLARGRDRDEVGLREVPVVLGVRLHAARRRDAGVLVPVPRLLDDGATGVEHGGLARDLVAHGALDRAERVDVLRLGARAERRLGRRAQRQVHVGADVAALHPGLRDV